MQKVYVVQEPTGIVSRFNPKSGRTERQTIDLSPALAYGELQVLFARNDPLLVIAGAPLVNEMRRRLKDFSDDDYLLAIGDPVAMCLAAVVAAQVNRGRYKMLKWDRVGARYIECRIEV